MVTTRFATPIWMAASPMPGALYMVSNMSSTSLRMLASTFFTGSDTCRSRLSGIVMISWIAIFGDLRGAESGVNWRFLGPFLLRDPVRAAIGVLSSFLLNPNRIGSLDDRDDADRNGDCRRGGAGRRGDDDCGA